MSEPTALPTDAERETAMRVMAWDPLTYAEFAKAAEDGDHPDDRESLEMVDNIAQALADQRARYEAVADELDRDTADRRRIAGATPCCDAAERIRRVSR